MRAIVGCALFVTASIALAPSSIELHRQYGEPTLARFLGRPGISVTVEYGRDRLACEVRISPARSLVEEERLRSAFQQHMGPALSLKELSRCMPSPAVTELINQLAPEAMRGKKIDGRSFQSSCLVMNMSDYENVDIARGINHCEPADQQDTGTSLSFKRDECPKYEPGVSIKK
ncbi:MAG: hypothetical protein WAK48_05350 [Candidatus Acidiferrum sp.]|jgi:hypothetical protein